MARPREGSPSPKKNLQKNAPVSPSQNADGEESHNPDVRVMKAPVTPRVGSRDMQRDYGNLYDRGTPPSGSGTSEEKKGPYNESYGQGGYPADFYGRDASAGGPSDDAVLDEDHSYPERPLSDFSNGGQENEYYRATDDEGFTNKADEPFGPGRSGPFAALDSVTDSATLEASAEEEELEDTDEDLDDEDLDDDDELSDDEAEFSEDANEKEI